MFFYHPVSALLVLAIQAVSLILIASIVLSWLEFWQRSSRSAPRLNMGHPVIRWIESVSYTILHPIRRVIEPYQRNTGIDFSPFIALLALSLIQGWVMRLPF